MTLSSLSLNQPLKWLQSCLVQCPFSPRTQLSRSQKKVWASKSPPPKHAPWLLSGMILMGLDSYFPHLSATSSLWTPLQAAIPVLHWMVSWWILPPGWELNLVTLVPLSHMGDVVACLIDTSGGIVSQETVQMSGEARSKKRSMMAMICMDVMWVISKLNSSLVSYTPQKCYLAWNGP
ncbi:hypothetical protein DSO57_1019364 [Entomophthora muscae]|uniref:Uncharacterized protein n=1 Tax=Entomophthora muscae TaxID=34485 RepID=A0ACC2U2D1_9FUNG|nr:hypothetical protein DSO57_1019364 [Entomophthora muscae]